MSRPLVVLLATAASFLPALASAADAPERPARLELRTRTLFLPMEESLTASQAGSPIFQWVELAGYDLETPGLSVHTSVWGFGALDGGGDRVTGEPVAGDVDLLYVEYADPKGRLQARAGRQLVFSAPGAGYFGQMDGGWLRGAKGPFNLELYGGQVVKERFRNWGEYDWLAGGRGGYHLWGRVNGGLSYFQARTAGALAREHAGADLSVVAAEHVDVVGSAAWDLVDQGFAESKALVRVEPLDRLTLGAGMEQASPGRLMDKSSIFSVFSLGDYAQADGFAQYAITRQWVVTGRYARVFFSDADGEGLGDAANRFGAGVSSYPRRDLWLTLDGDRVPAQFNGYSSLRLAGRYVPVNRWTVTADLLGFFYDEAPLSHDGAATQSLVARLFGEHRIGTGLHIGAGGEIAKTVLASLDVRGVVRITQDLDIISGGP